MSESTASLRFFRELAALLESPINVVLDSGKVYTGTLKGYEPSTLSLCLANAKDDKGNKYHRIFLYGSRILEITKTEEPFDLEGLAKELKTIFPPGEVKYLEDARVIVILNKIKVTEDGVEGTGPLAERVYKVYKSFIEEKKKEKES
ncbi:MAG: Lsm family RNA-binding protein [Candidatus Odinarchaeia archaeon]